MGKRKKNKTIIDNSSQTVSENLKRINKEKLSKLQKYMDDLKYVEGPKRKTPDLRSLEKKGNNVSKVKAVELEEQRLKRKAEREAAKKKK